MPAGQKTYRKCANISTCRHCLVVDCSISVTIYTKEILFALNLGTAMLFHSLPLTLLFTKKHGLRPIWYFCHTFQSFHSLTLTLLFTKKRGLRPIWYFCLTVQSSSWCHWHRQLATKWQRSSLCFCDFKALYFTQGKPISFFKRMNNCCASTFYSIPRYWALDASLFKFPVKHSGPCNAYLTMNSSKKKKKRRRHETDMEQKGDSDGIKYSEILL